MDGTLRNVIVVFFSFPALQGPETLVFAAFLIGAKHTFLGDCGGVFADWLACRKRGDSWKLDEICLELPDHTE